MRFFRVWCQRSIFLHSPGFCVNGPRATISLSTGAYSFHLTNRSARRNAYA
jgi:hypothetical protein